LPFISVLPKFLVGVFSGVGLLSVIFSYYLYYFRCFALVWKIAMETWQGARLSKTLNQMIGLGKHIATTGMLNTTLMEALIIN
tara:strand:+ start:131 stop:379 length:249 start_codon:yes stop_codon:yes gene_type:complete